MSTDELNKSIGSVLQSQIKVIGDDEYTMHGYPQQLINSLSELIQEQIRLARIDELNNVCMDCKGWHENEYQPLISISGRLAQLKTPQELSNDQL